MINLSRSKLLITFRRNLGSRKSYLGPLLVWTELNMQESYRVSQSEYIYIAVFVVCTSNLKPSYTTSLRPKLTHFCEWLNRLVTLAHVKLKIRHKCSLNAGGTLDDSIGWLSPSPLANRGSWIVSQHLFLRYITRNRTGIARSNPPRLETIVNNKRFKPFCFFNIPWSFAATEDIQYPQIVFLVWPCRSVGRTTKIYSGGSEF